MSSGSILVFGGNSRLALALRRHLPADTRYVARSASPRCIGVGTYATTPASLFDGVRTTINCAGIATGDADLLREANIDTPRHLAGLARGAGVKRFVHVSSFSVFGRAQYIDATTALAPVTNYGRSKLAAEEVLSPLANGDFSAVMVRLPAIVGAGGSDKLASLIDLWLRIHRLPVPRTRIRRSMISLDLAAKVLADIAIGSDRGIVHAADRISFTYQDAAAAITDRTGKAVGLVILPDAVIRLLGRPVPGLYASLYAQSLLAPTINRAANLSSDLYETIAAIALRRVKS